MSNVTDLSARLEALKAAAHKSEPEFQLALDKFCYGDRLDKLYFTAAQMVADVGDWVHPIDPPAAIAVSYHLNGIIDALQASAKEHTNPPTTQEGSCD